MTKEEEEARKPTFQLHLILGHTSAEQLHNLGSSLKKKIEASGKYTFSSYGGSCACGPSVSRIPFIDTGKQTLTCEEFDNLDKSEKVGTLRVDSLVLEEKRARDIAVRVFLRIRADPNLKVWRRYRLAELLGIECAAFVPDELQEFVHDIYMGTVRQKTYTNKTIDFDLDEIRGVDELLKDIYIGVDKKIVTTGTWGERVKKFVL